MGHELRVALLNTQPRLQFCSKYQADPLYYFPLFVFLIWNKIVDVIIFFVVSFKDLKHSI